MKKIRRTPKRVDSDRVAITREFQLLHKYITLVDDVLFVNGIPFLIVLSRKLHFVTVKHMRSRTDKQRSKYLNKSCKLYTHTSYNI